jgi:hypothetical protein
LALTVHQRQQRRKLLAPAHLTVTAHKYLLALTAHLRHPSTPKLRILESPAPLALSMIKEFRDVKVIQQLALRAELSVA